MAFHSHALTAMVSRRNEDSVSPIELDSKIIYPTPYNIHLFNKHQQTSSPSSTNQHNNSSEKTNHESISGSDQKLNNVKSKLRSNNNNNNNQRSTNQLVHSSQIANQNNQCNNNNKPDKLTDNLVNNDKEQQLINGHCNDLSSNEQSNSLNTSQISSLSNESTAKSNEIKFNNSINSKNDLEIDSAKQTLSSSNSSQQQNDVANSTNSKAIKIDKSKQTDVVEDNNLSTNNSLNSSTNDNLSDSTISANDLFPNVVFDLKELFRISVKFTKENENKAFHPTYDDRNYLYALNYQIRYGPFIEDKAPQLGALDFVGKDRRLAWASLGAMSKEVAMKQFISELNRICPAFKPFIEAHNQEKVERQRLLREEEERKRIEEEKRLKEEEEERLKREKIEKERKQKQEIKEALSKQTYYQFKSYAQQQYPNDETAQESLIKSLEEIHFQQYLERISQIQEQNQMNPNQATTSSSIQNQLVNGVQQINLNGNDQLQQQSTPTTSSRSLGPNVNNSSLSSDQLANNLDGQYSKIDQQVYMNNQRYLVNHHRHGESENEESDNDDDDDDEEDDEENSESDNEEEESYDDNYEGKSFQIAAPNMWTKKIIKAFKESISIDSGDGIVKIGYGETLTIRVPTHPNGNCIVWEFATDNYDIGFGLFFEPNPDPGDQVTIQVSESEDDEDEDDQDNDDPEKGSGNRKESKKSKTQYVLPIIPIFRRDSHEEVYCGSHVYCGKGIYLLKFDNTYSLWRSKTLYYRVFFSS